MSLILHQTITVDEARAFTAQLFMSSIPHQTITVDEARAFTAQLFMSSIPHQTTTFAFLRTFELWLFMPSILHQTTTIRPQEHGRKSCLYLQSYTKPQQPYESCLNPMVVYIFNPTPNHN